MKTIKLLFILALIIKTGFTQTLAVLGIDTKNMSTSAPVLSDLVRLEVEERKIYSVLDKYDVREILKNKGINSDQCYSKTCLVKSGEQLNAKKVISGSIERFGGNIVINLRMIDVSTGNIEATDLTEFIDHETEIQSMITISVNKLLGLENDVHAMQVLVKTKGPLQVPQARLHLNGPRMGLAYVTGKLGERLQADADQGGFDSYPVMTQFGYQIETQYINNGNFQALFEFVPNISGLDQGLFIPSVSFMNGFRNNKSGWEIAFGPTFSARRVSSGYYTTGENGQIWHLTSEWDKANGTLQENGYKVTEEFDSRGFPSLTAGWIWAAGKTFRSGYLNIPVNLFVLPNKSGWISGVSIGFNMSQAK